MGRAAPGRPPHPQKTVGPMEDYYEILEVHPKASEEVIGRAYRVLALRYHPDVHPPDRREWADGRMKRLNEAYAVLGDSQKRAAYDVRREAQATAGAPAARVHAAAAPARRASAGPAVADTSRCALHPDRKRASVCLECRRSVCLSCRVLRDGRPYCPECAAKLARAAALPAPGFAQAPTPPFGHRSFQERLSSWGWMNAALATGALMLWLHATLAPLVVCTRAGAAVVATTSACVALLLVGAGVVAAEGLAAALPAAARRRSAAILALPLIGALALGVRQEAALWVHLDQRIADGERAIAAWRTFASAFPQPQPSRQSGSAPAASPVPPRFQRFAFERLLQDSPRQAGPPAGAAPQPAPTAHPLPTTIPERPIGAARDFLATEYSRRKGHLWQRAVCLAFVVWAASKQGDSADAGALAAAREYGSLAEDPGLKHPGWKRICDSYLHSKNAVAAQAERERAEAEQKKREKDAEDRNAREEQERQGREEQARKVREEQARVEQARKAGEDQARAEQERKTREEQTRRAREDQARAEQEKERLRRDAILRPAVAASEMIARGDPRGLTLGITVLTPALQAASPEWFEGLAYQMAEMAVKQKDARTLTQVTDQYINVSRLRRHQTVFNEWRAQLGRPPMAVPAIQQGGA